MAAPIAPPPQMTIRLARLMPSVQAVELHGTGRHDLVLRLGRQAFHALPQHLRCAGAEAVAVRIVGRPQDLVRADVLGERADRALARFERDPAVPPEQIALALFHAGIVTSLAVAAR